MRVDTASLISGALVCGNRGLGVLGALIPATGDSGPGYAYNDLSLPADNAKEICGRITSWPTNGTLYAYEDTSFEYIAFNDGADSFQYQLSVDGVNTGAPTTVLLQVGAATAAIAATTDDAAFSGASASAVSATFAITLDDAVFSGSAYQAGAPNEVSIFATTDDATFSGGVFVPGTPATVQFAITLDDATFAGSATTGSFSGALSDADIERIVVAVLAALNATAIPVNATNTSDIASAVWSRTLP